MKIAVSGRVQTADYTNQDGNKVYVTNVIVEGKNVRGRKEDIGSDGFMNLVEGEELPFEYENI